MRSLFWRILASFWLAIALVAGLSILLGHMLNQDAWILSRHPGIANLAQQWTERYETQGADAAQDFLERRKRRYHIDVQVLNESGKKNVLVAGVDGLSEAINAIQNGDQYVATALNDPRYLGEVAIEAARGLATGKTIEQAAAEFDGKGYGEFKPAVGEAVVELLRPIREKTTDLLNNKDYLEQVYKEGAQKASYLARKTLDKVYRKVGFVAR